MEADFDSDAGGYSNVDGYVFSWVNATGGYPGIDASGNADGGYMMVDVYDYSLEGGEIYGVLESPEIHQVYGRCQLKLWYYLIGYSEYVSYFSFRCGPVVRFL